MFFDELQRVIVEKINFMKSEILLSVNNYSLQNYLEIIETIKFKNIKNLSIPQLNILTELLNLTDLPAKI